MRVEDPQSAVADAAEEITFSAGEKAAQKLKTKKTRSQRNRLEEIKRRLEKYLDRIPDLGPEQRIARFLEHLRKRGWLSREEAAREAEKFFGDVSAGYAALELAAEILEEEGAPKDWVAEIRGAAAELMERSGPEVRAGLNVSATAQKFEAEGLGELQDLRRFYREAVLSYEGMAGLYEKLLERFGTGSSLEEGIRFLVEACGNDLHAEGPSIPPAKLKEIVDALYRLELLGNLRKDCVRLLGELKSLFGLSRPPQAEKLLVALLRLKEESWPSVNSVLRLASEVGPLPLEGRIFFLTELKKTAMAIPLKAYRENENRERFLGTLQEALDTLIEKEEG